MQSRANFSEPSLEALSAKMISTCEKMVCRRNDSRQRGIHWTAFQFKIMTLTTGAGGLTFIEKLAAQNVPDPVFIFNPFPRRHNELNIFYKIADMDPKSLGNFHE